MAIQRKAISSSNKKLGKSNGRTSTADDKAWIDEIEKKKASQQKKTQQQYNTNDQKTPQTSSALNAANQSTYTVPKEKLQIKSNIFNDTKESEGLTGVAKDQMNYIVNKGKEVLDSRKKEFENWYTPDKQTLLFNDDGSLKDVKGELDAVNSQIRGNIAHLKFDEYKALNDKKKQLEEAVKYSDYLVDQNTADNLTDKNQIKRFYTLQDAYNDTFGERALKTVGSSLTSIVNTPFELYDVAKEFVTQGKEKANAEGNISKIINNDIQNLNEEIYYNTNAAEQFALQTVGGVSQFLAHLGLAAFTGGGANMALATMSLQSGTEKAYQNIEEGYDVNTAILNGVMTGAMTALTEKLPIDNVIKIANSGLAQFSLAAIGSQALSEGLEEGVEYLAEPLIDKLTLGKNIEYEPGELFMAMALGMSSGAIIGIGANAIPTIKSTRSANQLKADMNTLIEYQKVNNLTSQEKTVFDQVIGLAQSAINRFEGKSVIGDAVKLSGDVVKPLSANEVSQNLKQALQPGLDMNTRIAEQMNTFKSIMNNAQNMLNMKGINMDATQYAFLDENVKNQVDKVQNYANELNVPVVFDVNMDSTGMYYNGVVYVNPESNLAPLTTFVHELTHGSESSKYYDSLSNLFTGNKNLSDELQTIKEKYAQHDIKLDDEAALKEYVAIQTQDSLGNEKFVDRLVKYNNSLAYRIYAGIKNIVSKTNTMQDIEYNFLKTFRDNPSFENIKVLNDGASYSVGMTFDEAVDKVLDNKYYPTSDHVLLDQHTPDVFLENIESINDLPMLIEISHVKSAVGQGNKKHLHNLSIETLKSVPELLKNPLFIYFNTNNNSYNAILNAKDNDGNPVIVAITPNKKGRYNSVIIDTNIVKTIFGAENFEKKLDSNVIKNDLIYPKGYTKKDMISWMNRDQSPTNQVSYRNNIITDRNKYSNKSIETNTYNLENRLSIDDLKQKQLDIILESNPARNEFSTWIRNLNDIKTFEETLQDNYYHDESFTPDYTLKMALDAIENGKIRVYSSHPIENGIFVTPSKMEATSYSGNGKVYSKDVDLTDVAWIDPTQGQYAKVDKNKYSVGLSPEDLKNTLKYNRDVNKVFSKLEKFGVNKDLIDSDYEMLYNKAIFEVLNKKKISNETLNEIRKETWDRMAIIVENPNESISSEIRSFMEDQLISMDSLGFTDRRFDKSQKGGVGDFVDMESWNEFRKKHFGTLNFRKNGGTSIDTIYQEINNMYPGVMNPDLTTPYEQLMEITKFVDDKGEKEKVHLSKYGMKKETFDSYFNELMSDFENDIKVFETQLKFAKKLEEEKDIYLSNENIQHIMDGTVTADEYNKFVNNKDAFIEVAKEWVPNYKVLRDKYKNISENVFSKAVFDEFVYGELSSDTREFLIADILDNMFETSPGMIVDRASAKKIADEFVNDSIQHFQADATYKTNKKYMQSIATKVNNLISRYSGLYDGTYEKTYKAVEDIMKAEELLEASKKVDKEVLADVIQTLLFSGNDYRSNWRTLEQNLDIISGKNADLREMLRNTLELPRYEAQMKFVNTLNKYNSVLNNIVKDLGIREGSDESKAVQYMMEGHREDYSPYDIGILMTQFDYKMENNKKAYENIEEAASMLRVAYNELYKEIDSIRESIYGDVEAKYEQKLAEMEANVRTKQHTVDILEEKMKKNPTPELTAGYNTAQNSLKKAQKDLKTAQREKMNNDATRRQKLPFRDNYAHHIPMKKGFFRSVFDAGRKVPSKLSGISDTSKPKSGFANFFKKQTGASYVPDAVAGFAAYIQDASKIIAYDPLIEYYRGFTSDLRDAAKGTEMTGFIEYMNDYTNSLASKTNEFDRGGKKTINDKAFTAIKKLNSKVKANALLGNARTAIAQFLNLPNGLGVIVNNGGIKGTEDIMKGTINTITSMFEKNTPSDSSPFLQSRFFNVDTGDKRLKSKINDVFQIMMTKGDEIVTKMIWNMAYEQGVRTQQEDPIFYADDLTRRSVAGRGNGEVPLALQSELIGLVMPFQVETNNAFRTMTGMTRDLSGKSISAILTILLADWFVNCITEWLGIGRNLFDPIDVIQSSINEDGEPAEKALNTSLRMLGEVIANTPGGQYVPGIFGMVSEDAEKYFGESDPTRYGTGNLGLKPIGEAFMGTFDTLQSISTGNTSGAIKNGLDTISDISANYLMPAAGKQTQRTIEALQVNGMLPQYQNGQLVNEPIHYTGSGKVGFVNNPEAIMDNPSNFIDFAKQVLFGKWAGKNAQEYINSNFNGLGSDKQNDMFKELAQSLSPIDAYNAVKGINQAKEDSVSSSENDTSNDELLSEFDSKKEELNGKRDSKTKFIDYITSSDYSYEQKNYIFDEYYGDSNLATFINDFAESKNLDDETIYNMKSLTSTAEGVEGSNGKSIKNSKSLKVRKELEQLGVYDDFVQYIYKNDLDPSTFGLNDSVMEMSNADFNYNYQNIYGEAYTSKSNEQLMQEAYAATFGKTIPSLKKQQKALQKAYDEEMKKRENFKKDLAKIANGTSTKNNYKNVNSILQSALKNTKSNSIKTSNSDFVDDLIKKYKEDHPYDNLFS